MPDTPDFDKYRPGSVRFSLQDMGELAARLGSSITYDRRGEVVFVDNFDNGVGSYAIGYSGGAGTMVTSALKSIHGGYSALFTTGAGTDDSVFANREFSSSDLGKCGVEASFCMTGSNTEFRITIEQFIDTQQKTFAVIVDKKNNQLRLWTGVSTETVIDTLSWTGSLTNIFRHLKLVVDFESMTYVRLLFDDKEYDLQQYGGFIVAVSAQNAYLAILTAKTKVASSKQVFMGHVIITGNEP